MTKPRVLVVDDSASILRVVESVLSGAGYDVKTEQDGSRAVGAATAFQPDLVLLDFMMPQLNGHQVAQRLRAERRTHGTPIVLMCSRGDVDAERAVKTLGIVDSITKPFSPDAVLALVSYTLEKHRPSRASPRTSPAAPGGGDPFNVPSAEHEVVSSDQTQVHTIPPELFEEPTRLGSPVVPPAEDDPEATSSLVPQVTSTRAPRAEPTGTADVLARVVAQRLSTAGFAAPEPLVRAALEEALALIPPPAHPATRGTKAAMWGDLTQVPLPEVFQLMTLQGQTGLFQVWVEDPGGQGRGTVRFDVHFSRGKVDFAQGTNLHEDFLLGRFLVGNGAIERAELDALLRARKGGGKLLGQQLVALGYITREQLTQALRDQCSELVYELLRSQRGTFSLSHDAPRPVDLADVHLGISVDELLLEGLRRVDEWGVIGKEIASFDIQLEPDRHGNGENLSEDERYVLSHVEPGVTVRDLVARTHMRPFDVAKICYRLIMARQVRRA